MDQRLCHETALKNSLPPKMPKSKLIPPFERLGMPRKEFEWGGHLACRFEWLPATSSVTGRQVKASYCALLPVIADKNSGKKLFQVDVVAAREDHSKLIKDVQSHSKVIKANQSVFRKKLFL